MTRLSSTLGLLRRQLQGALQPHDACALLAAPLAAGLAALRAGRDALEVPGPAALHLLCRRRDALLARPPASAPCCTVWFSKAAAASSEYVRSTGVDPSKHSSTRQCAYMQA